MSQLINNNNMQEHIVSAQVSSLYSALPISQFATVINAFLLYFVQRSHVDSSTARYWLWTLLAMVVLRLSLYALYRFPQQEYLERDNAVWRNLFLFTTAISGIIWGSSGIFLLPDDDIRHQIFLVFVIAGMASGSIATLSAEKNTATFFLIALMTPAIIQFTMFSDVMLKIMGFMGLFSLVSFIILSRHINRQFIENVILTTEAKYREIESMQYSSLLMQTQKLANICGWEADLREKQIKLSPEFNTIFAHLIDYKPQIIDAILNATAKSEAFDFELSLLVPNTVRKYWVRIIGGIRINNSDFLHGAIQDISAIKTIQLDLDNSRKQVIDYSKKIGQQARFR